MKSARDSGTRARLAVAPGTRAFVVDDSDIALDAIGIRLEEAGFTVILRNTAVGARAAMLREHPDLAILDVSLPLMSGPEIVTSMRQHPRLRNTSVLLCSAQEPENLERLATGCGADGYVTKDDLENLARIATTLVSRRMRTRMASSVLVVGGGKAMELARVLSDQVQVRHTDSATEALRMMLSVDPPSFVVLATVLSDLEPTKLIERAIAHDPQWKRRISVLLEEDQVPVWAQGLPHVSVTASSLRDVASTVLRLRAA